MAAVLVFSENAQVACELLGKAKELSEALGLKVCAVTFGQVAAEDLAARGPEVVYVVKGEGLEALDAKAGAEALAALAAKTSAKLILMGSTRRGKEMGARLAQKLGAGCITDVNQLELKDGQVVCSRNALGGATVATQVVLTDVKVILAVPKAFEPAALSQTPGRVEEVELSLSPARVKVVEKKSKDKGAADIEGAQVLVCIGKGLSGPDKLPMIEELAQALGGVVACTKPVATDEKWLPEDRIIGLSGKKSKPELALCLGISGQVQFTVGIRDAKTIVAVNTDQNAYIFQMADYGIVGDLHEVVPALTKAIKG